MTVVDLANISLYFSSLFSRRTSMQIIAFYGDVFDVDLIRM